MLRSPALAGVPHAFLAGIGQPGEPDPELLVEGGELVLVKQVHSPIALAAEAPFPLADRPEADALATSRAGLVLGVVTADCAPVLLADAEAGVVGAAHAGWRGAHFGVLEAVVRRMVQLGAARERIAAAIGPTIAQDSYEVGWDFYERFEERNDRFFCRSRPGKWQFDLPAYVAARLKSCGIGQIDDLAIDTYTEVRRFHSYRRAVHRGEPREGRQYSLVAVPR